jgi:hypothetical protein
MVEYGQNAAQTPVCAGIPPNMDMNGNFLKAQSERLSLYSKNS